MKFRVICFVALFPSLLLAQIELERGLLFPEFVPGRAVMENQSGVTTGLFNYNTIDEEMLFKDNQNTVLALANPADFVLINIAGRIFEYAQNASFYERLSLGNDIYLYKQWKSKIISEGKSSAYGGRSQTAAVTTISSLSGTGGTYAWLLSGETFKAKTECAYYLKIKGRFRKISTPKSLGKLFKKYENEIAHYADSEKIDFSNEQDVIRIVKYVYQINNK